LCTSPTDPSTCSDAVQTTAAVLGDPMIIGLQGQKFQVHGIAGEIYNLISHPQLQLNADFVFLSQGTCPPTDKTILCWSHPGSYIGRMGLMVRNKQDGADTLEIVSGSATQGLATVLFNNQSLKIGSTTSNMDQTLSIQWISSHHLIIETPVFSIGIENSDMFLNERITPRVSFAELAKSHTHGIIGQTYAKNHYTKNQISHIEGEVDDYRLSERHIFGQEFSFNQW